MQSKRNFPVYKYLTRVRVATCYTEWEGNTLMTLLIVLVGGGGGGDLQMEVSSVERNRASPTH